jgi:hypothetical protein
VGGRLGGISYGMPPHGLALVSVLRSRCEVWLWHGQEVLGVPAYAGLLPDLGAALLPSPVCVYAGADKVGGEYQVKLADFGLSTKVTAKMQRLRSMKSCDPGLPVTASAPAGTSAA